MGIPRVEHQTKNIFPHFLFLSPSRFQKFSSSSSLFFPLPSLRYLLILFFSSLFFPFFSFLHCRWLYLSLIPPPFFFLFSVDFPFLRYHRRRKINLSPSSFISPPSLPCVPTPSSPLPSCVIFRSARSIISDLHFWYPCRCHARHRLPHGKPRPAPSPPALPLSRCHPCGKAPPGPDVVHPHGKPRLGVIGNPLPMASPSASLVSSPSASPSPGAITLCNPRAPSPSVSLAPSPSATPGPGTVALCKLDTPPLAVALPNGSPMASSSLRNFETSFAPLKQQTLAKLDGPGCTKVYKLGSVTGRAIDLSKLGVYDDLLYELE